MMVAAWRQENVKNRPVADRVAILLYLPQQSGPFSRKQMVARRVLLTDGSASHSGPLPAEARRAIAAMSHLSLSFLGGFGVTLDGAPITGFDSDKTRALLAY